MPQVCNAPHVAYHAEAARKILQNVAAFWSHGYLWHFRNMIDMAKAQNDFLQFMLTSDRTEELRAFACGMLSAAPPGWVEDFNNAHEDILLSYQLMDDGFGSNFFDREDHLGDAYA